MDQSSADEPHSTPLVGRDANTTVAEQGDVAQRTAQRDYYEQHYHAPDGGPGGRQNDPLLVLFTAIPPLRPVWEAKLNDVIDRLSNGRDIRINCDTADGRVGQLRDAAVYVVAFDFFHQNESMAEVRAAVRRCRESGNARILVVGCGVADESESVLLCKTIRSWGIPGPWHGSTFAAPADFGDWVSEHLQIVISYAKRLR